MPLRLLFFFLDQIPKNIIAESKVTGVFKAWYIFLNYLPKRKYSIYWHQQNLCGYFTAFLSGIWVIYPFNIHTTNICKVPNMCQVLVIKHTKKNFLYLPGPIVLYKFCLNFFISTLKTSLYLFFITLWVWQPFISICSPALQSTALNLLSPSLCCFTSFISYRLGSQIATLVRTMN